MGTKIGLLTVLPFDKLRTGYACWRVWSIIPDYLLFFKKFFTGGERSQKAFDNKKYTDSNMSG